MDHFSRRVLGFAVFTDKPNSLAVRTLLGWTIGMTGRAPKYLICDKGVQFWCADFKNWCRRRHIKPRYGAVGKHGSIAVIERFIGTVKREGSRRLLIPLRRTLFRAELKLFCDWYNEHRPHMTLEGCTPDEIYHQQRPANRRPRCEPRLSWPRPSRCATPQTLVAGQPGDQFSINVEFDGDHKRMPIVTLQRAA